MPGACRTRRSGCRPGCCRRGCRRSSVRCGRTARWLVADERVTFLETHRSTAGDRAATGGQGQGSGRRPRPTSSLVTIDDPTSRPHVDPFYQARFVAIGARGCASWVWADIRVYSPAPCPEARGLRTYRSGDLGTYGSVRNADPPPTSRMTMMANGTARRRRPEDCPAAHGGRARRRRAGGRGERLRRRRIPGVRGAVGGQATLR